jgi:hypothetical protein
MSMMMIGNFAMMPAIMTRVSTLEKMHASSDIRL